jgi:hypothetical protein
MQVHILYYHFFSPAYLPKTEIYIYKDKNKAIEKANTLHDSFPTHQYKRCEQYFDKEEKKFLKKNPKVCYFPTDPDRYRNCSLDEAALYIEEATLNLENDLLLRLNPESYP